MEFESAVDQFDYIRFLTTPRSVWHVLPFATERVLLKEQEELPLRRCPACNVVLLGGPVIRPHSLQEVQCPASYQVAHALSLGRDEWYYNLWPDWTGKDWKLEAF